MKLKHVRTCFSFILKIATILLKNKYVMGEKKDKQKHPLHQ